MADFFFFSSTLSLSLVLFYYIEEVVVTSLLSRISFQQRRCNAQGSRSKGVMGTIAPINVEKIFQCSCKLFHRILWLFLKGFFCNFSISKFLLGFYFLFMADYSLKQAKNNGTLHFEFIPATLRTTTAKKHT